MSGFNPELTNRGNYRCPYCGHHSWKQWPSAKKHIETQHEIEAKQHNLEQDNRRLRAELENARLEKKQPEYGESQVMFCTYCKKIFKAPLPIGGSFEDSIHVACGTANLHPVSNPPFGM